MRPLLLSAALAVPLLVSPVLAAQPECPVAWGEVDAAIEASSTCLEASLVLHACVVGSGADVSRAYAVREICERDFHPGLKPGAKRAYARAQRRCDRRYAGEEGTMYRSMEALCAAQLAKSYSDRASKKR